MGLYSSKGFFGGLIFGGLHRRPISERQETLQKRLGGVIIGLYIHIYIYIYIYIYI